MIADIEPFGQGFGAYRKQDAKTHNRQDPKRVFFLRALKRSSRQSPTFRNKASLRNNETLERKGLPGLWAFLRRKEKNATAIAKLH